MLIEALPRESRTIQIIAGDRVRWGSIEHLLADVVDVLQAANWQRIGKRNAPRPKPVSRPGVTSTNTQKIGGTKTYTPEQMAKIQSRWGKKSETEE